MDLKSDNPPAQHQNPNLNNPSWEIPVLRSGEVDEWAAIQKHQLQLNAENDMKSQLLHKIGQNQYYEELRWQQEEKQIETDFAK